MNQSEVRISVVTATLSRPNEVRDLITNLSELDLPPLELILVDGAADDVFDTQNIVQNLSETYPFKIRYLRHKGGTAIQRNHGIDAAEGNYIAFVDDDVRLKPYFFSKIIKVFDDDKQKKIGGITGFRENMYFRLEDASRWRWYKRLKLLTTFEPGRYDYYTGYPINNSMHPPFEGVREVDFMTTANTVWRKEVFDEGLRFDEFFTGFGVLEDAHLSLRAKQKWILLQCGDAKSIELSARGGREKNRSIGVKVVTNYYYVFKSIAGPLSFRQKRRFFTYQGAELVKTFINVLRRKDRLENWQELTGRFKGLYLCLTNKI